MVVTCGAISLLVNFGDGSRTPDRVGANQVYDQPINHLDLELLKGDVTIETAVDNRVDVSYETSFFDVQPQPQHRVSGETLSVWFGGCGRDDCWIDYTIKVPEATTLSLTVEDGDIDVHGVAGRQDLTTEFGDISSTGGTGAVSAWTETGRIDLHDVTGDVDVHTESGGIELSQVSGNVVARTEEGDVTGIALQSATVDATAADGDVDLVFETAPENITIKVDSGDAAVRVPDDGTLYRVIFDAGDEPADIAVGTSATADRIIDITVENGLCLVDYR